jgi:CRISPR-associated protein Cmr1
MFLGNAAGEAQWRAESFKALFRSWWRVTRHETDGKDALFQEEAVLFGAAGDEKTSHKSPLSIAVLSKAKADDQSLRWKKVSEVDHEECERQHKKVDPLLYLAGMGLLMPGNKLKPGRTYFPPGSCFTLTLQYPGGKENEAAMNSVLALIQAFGAIGGRCRNGWGSFRVKNPAVDLIDTELLLDGITKDWTKGLKEDYPNSLGRDGENRPLLWKTEAKSTWEEAMAELAKAYIGVRAHDVAGIRKLNPGERNNVNLQERHLLGIPLTNHNYGRGDSRHASPLRFVVKKQVDSFLGFILHIPHSHSQNQKFAAGVNQQQVWEKVHRKLDGQKTILSRASYKEVLA